MTRARFTFTPRKRISTREWTRRLVPAEKLREIVDLPYVAEPFDALDEHRARVCMYLAPVQVWKTAGGQLRLARSMMVEPRDSLFYSSTQAAIEEVADSKFNPLFDSVPELMALLHRDRNKRTKARYSMPSGHTVQLLSAGVLLNRNSKSATDLYLDESWTYDPGAIEEIQDRRAASPDTFRELHMLTGPTAGSEAHALWLDSPQRTWHMRCLECGELINPEFGSPEEAGGIRYEAAHLHADDPERGPDWPAFAGSIVYECPHCGHRHADSPLTRQRMNEAGAYLTLNPDHRPDIMGWRTHGIACRSWLGIVQQWIKANALKRQGEIATLENVVRKVFADVWDENLHLAIKRLKPIGDYLMGEEWGDEGSDPHGRPWRICTVDVQQDHYVLTIRMWAADGRSRLRWAEKVTTPSRINDLASEHGVLPERVFLDARHEKQQVLRLCARFGWRAIMGEGLVRDYIHDDGMRKIYSKPRAIDPFLGTLHAGRSAAALFMFSKAAALDRLHIMRGLKVGDTDQPMWTAASNAPPWYFKEVDAFFRVKKTQPDGSHRYEWKAPQADHGADCEAMGIVVASMAGFIGAESLDGPATEADGKPPALNPMPADA